MGSFGPEKYDASYNRIRYHISLKLGITYASFHNSARIKIDSYDFLALEKTLTIHNVIILIKSVFDNNQNHFYYNIFLKIFSYQLAEK